MLRQTGKLKISKAGHQKIGLISKRRTQMNKHSGGTASGLTSMYAFTDKAGLELGNPDSAFQKKEDNSYFDPKSGFAAVLANKSKNVMLMKIENRLRYSLWMCSSQASHK
jgi:hypothetical protein